MALGRNVPILSFLSNAKRRTFTANYKPEILAAYDAAPDGEKGALLRREGRQAHVIAATPDVQNVWGDHANGPDDRYGERDESGLRRLQVW
jgi:hypothetical protein